MSRTTSTGRVSFTPGEFLRACESLASVASALRGAIRDLQGAPIVAQVAAFVPGSSVPDGVPVGPRGLARDWSHVASAEVASADTASKGPDGRYPCVAPLPAGATAPCGRSTKSRTAATIHGVPGTIGSYHQYSALSAAIQAGRETR